MKVFKEECMNQVESNYRGAHQMGRAVLATSLATLTALSPLLAYADNVDDDKTTADERRALDRAEAEARRNQLDSQPAVRQRKLLVAKRFELGLLGESTINADFRHILGGGLKLEYHFTDMISFGAVGVGSFAINTKLIDRINPTLDADTDMRSPTSKQLAAHLNSIPLHGAVYLSVTPWYGKLAAFGKSFLNFDFYFQAGLAVAKLDSSCGDDICTDKNPGVSSETLIPDGDPNDDAPLNSGTRLGLYLGGGIHVFLSDSVALDLSIRDYAFVDNPSGADFNADLFVSDADNRFLQHLFFGLGASIMLPTTVKRTR
jgi:outer membrane beta-barrel protein